MSSSYFMLKMLRSKHKRKCQYFNEKLKSTKQESVSDTTKFNLYICRVCLKDGSIPIYSVGNSFDVAEAVQTFGGIKLGRKDSLPKHLCDICYSLLQGAVKFRESALQSDEFLNKVPNVSIDIINEDNDNLTDTNDVKIEICKPKKLISKTYSSYRKSKQHSNVRIECPICHGLLTASLYKKHLARHESASHLVCEVCGKLYRKDNLIRHLQLHSYELPFQCQLCPYRGRFLESLKTHMHTHTGYKPFSCDNCNLRFLTRSNLNRHLLTHKQEKPFKCVECNRGFYTQRDMDVHFKGDHVGIKDFGCRLCGNKYSTRKALMRHELRVHKRVKMAKGRMPLYLQAEYIKNNERIEHFIFSNIKNN